MLTRSGYVVNVDVRGYVVNIDAPQLRGDKTNEPRFPP
jgi:hypothetical protein